jgi:lipopolysaccharide transport system ATP-binding protein
MSVLNVSGVGKCYRHYGSDLRRLAAALGLPARSESEHWVLRDLGFAVHPGEAVGLVGQNGAGKSTLLKIIAGTVAPSEGHVEVRGRISAILELGMGFNPEATGRENVHNAAGLMGFSQAEIEERIEEIYAFCELEDYFDEPVRTYSSGMQMRLAFAVATAWRPEVLIVDEALSVGDTYFQHKSFDRIRGFQEQGTTLLIVSHSAGSIKSLCTRALLLDQGRLIMDGPPDSVLDFYNANLAKKSEGYQIIQKQNAGRVQSTRSGNGQAVIESVDLLAGGVPVQTIQSGARSTVRIRGRIVSDIDELTVGLLIRDRLGNDVFGTNSHHHNASQRNLVKGKRFEILFDFPQMMLGVGSFNLTIALHSDLDHVGNNYDWWDRATVFEVIPGNEPDSIGVCVIPVTIHWESTN